MTPKEWYALFAFYAAYLFFGASVFYHNEHAMEIERRASELAERIEMNELLTKYLAPEEQELQNELLVRVSGYCGRKLTNHTTDEFTEPYVWNFYHSFYFAFIVCSTIGYGNISPNNTFGRIFMIFYALIGLPVNGFFFAYLGDMYGKTYVRLYRRYKAYKMSSNSHYVPRKFSLIGQIALYLIPGIVIFIFLPASVFCYFEKWPYDVGVYYAFVTLTTIGFGDYTSTFEPSQEHEFGIVYTLYRVFVILWFFAGVGYVFMILGFIAKGLAHEKVQRLEKMLAYNVMETQQRVWNGVTKDISYLRKILNEVYMLKFKPVYKEPSDRLILMNIGRSASCPDLTIYREEAMDLMAVLARKRAFSMTVTAAELDAQSQQPALARRSSDSDLCRINREKTFGVEALVQPAELLAKVVTALGNITTVDEDTQSIFERTSTNGGINCFSDSQILASERSWSGWSIPGSDKNYAMSPPTERPRAFSVIGPTLHQPTNPNDWTWSAGDNMQIKEMMKIRQKSMTNPRKSLLRAAISNSKQYGSNLSVDMPPARDELQPKNRGLLGRLGIFRKRLSASESKRNSIFDEEAPRPVESYLAKTRNGRASMFNFPQHNYLTATSGGRSSLFSPRPSDEHVLETTTIGDLLRALEQAHMQSVAPNYSTIGYNDSRRRKDGTSSPPRMPSLANLFVNPPGSRRGSLKPPASQNPSITIQTSPLSQSPVSSSYRSANPPPYSAATNYPTSPKPMHRRFSVRPSNLAYPPGKCPRSASISSDIPIPQTASLQVPTTTLQRRLSARPSPLAGQSQTLPLVGSYPGGTPSTLTTKPNWRPTYLRSDSAQMNPRSPGLQQRGPAAAPANAAAATALGKRCRHSSVCQMENPKRGDFS
ncbi:open rectifier potassium channel protein 1 isoform X2 [Toxorhynchites rutilus septentrionalis]|uniref:open rectifier potassium channel protein 1 isoform X2 n=1 Tax=Toxorhynchites rutilus septentrionalis TaxID=329112 RepID=UPI0024796EDD|nr:open rectifier potassium channel protein 1 isoform X2 [Toxorhynchites rutilus septentrionalis]